MSNNIDPKEWRLIKAIFLKPEQDEQVKGLGQRQINALAFALTSDCTAWKSFDNSVKREILSLQNRGLVEVDLKTMQFKPVVN